VKPFREQSHYDLLEVPVTARRDEIERAYPLIRAAYEPGALASYSVFASDEVAQICERIDAAYEVLTDEEARRRYDTLIGVAAEAPANEAAPPPGAPDASLGGAGASALDDLDEVEDEDQGGWDGAKLRRARLRRGVEVTEIAEITKINPRYLRAIEEEAYADLPAAVYTRGFVTAHARTLEIDPGPVVRDIMDAFEQARSERPRPRRLTGRR